MAHRTVLAVLLLQVRLFELQVRLLLQARLLLQVRLLLLLLQRRRTL